MRDPLVCCVMLVNGRPKMVRRAVASFRAQTYERKSLIILDTGTPAENVMCVQTSHMPMWAGRSIGALRNEVNALGASADIMAHLDSDDLSNPNRLTEQVAFLQASNAECVGYNQAAFWHEEKREAYIYTGMIPNKNIVGASMMYWRSAWERHPFENMQHGSDTATGRGFVWKVMSAGCSGVVDEPRIICAIHKDSTTKGTPAVSSGHNQWVRATHLDAYCAEKMELSQYASSGNR